MIWIRSYYTKRFQVLLSSTCFKIVNNVKGVHALQEDNAYTKLLDRLIQVASDMKLDLNKIWLLIKH